MTTATAHTGEQQSAGRKPTHRLYIVTGDGDKASWRPIGAGWSHSDGKGFNLNCDALPLQGRLVMREVKPANAATDDQGGLL